QGQGPAREDGHPHGESTGGVRGHPAGDHAGHRREPQALTVAQEFSNTSPTGRLGVRWGVLLLDENPTRNRCCGIQPGSGSNSATAALSWGSRMVWLIGWMLTPSAVAVSQSRSKSWPVRTWARWVSSRAATRPMSAALPTIFRSCRA